MKDPRTIRVLLIDDNKEEYFLLREIVSEVVNIHLKLDWVKSYDEGIREIKKESHDVYLIDYFLGAKSGIDLLKEVLQYKPRHCLFVLLTGQGNLNIEMDALRVGADDYLSKDGLNAELLERSLRYGLERKWHVIELKKSKNQYKQIYLNTKTPVIEVDLNYNVLKVNQAFNETFKYEENFVIDPKKQELKVWDILDCNHIKEKVINHINNKLEKSAEVFDCYTQEKEVLKVQMNVYELLNSFGEYSYQIVLNDLTLKIQEDEERYQKEKINLMEKMARIVAHEVRNPLSNIMLSNEQLVPEVDENKRFYTDIIKRNSLRIEDLIKKFLQTFRQAEINKEASLLSCIVKSCVQDFEDKALLLNVELTTEFMEDEPKTNLDATSIQLVLNNLINNAIQACEGRVNSKIKLSVFKDRKNICVEVADNGPGIDEKDFKQLFDPFFTKKQNGLGLGLTSSLNILRSHNGELLASNNKEGGATFLIKLPLG